MNRKTLVTLITFAFVTVSSLPLSATENETLLGYLYQPLLAPADQHFARDISQEIKAGNYDAALTASKSLLNKNAMATPPLYDATTLGQIYINHAIIQFTQGNVTTAYETMLNGLSLAEQSTNPFDESLVPALMAKGVMESETEDWLAAEDTFRRAQHIVHRQDGVYSENQLESLLHLTKTSMRLGKPIAADKQQLFTLKVAERAYGEDSEELLPILTQVASYFAIRSYTMPPSTSAELKKLRDRLFRNSIRLYNRSIEIIEATHGENDLRLLAPLRGLANVRLRHVTSRARSEQLLLRARQIVEDHPASDDYDIARAIVDLGDLYTIMRNHTDASAVYLEAWGLLQKDSGSLELGNELFGTPVRLYPDRKEVIELQRTPDAAKDGEPLFASLTFQVDETGKVRDVAVTGRNIPNEPLRNLRQNTRGALYRPRIADGTLVATDGLEIYQRYSARHHGDTPQPDSSAPSSPTTMPVDEPTVDSADSTDAELLIDSKTAEPPP